MVATMPLVDAVVHQYVHNIGPHWGKNDYIKSPVFPEGRKDFCVVQRSMDNGRTGWEVLYLIFSANNRKGFDYVFLSQRRDEPGPLDVTKVTVTEGNDHVTITAHIADGRTFSHTLS